MKNSTNKKKLQIVLLVLIAVLTLGIGYASITAINLIINGNATASAQQSNFQVYFTNSSITEGKGTVSIDENDATIGYFDITGLSKVGDYAEATYTVLNDSNGVGANISLQLTNSNNEYFKVTETVADSQLQAGDETSATVKVEMIKTPIENAVTTSVTAKLIANPIDNAMAIGGEEKSKVIPKNFTYSISNTLLWINQSIPDEVTTYNSFNTATQELGYPVAIAHLLEEGIITESYVEFEMNNNNYFLRGFINEETQEKQAIFNENVNTLKKAYGLNWTDYCEEYTDNIKRFNCNDGMHDYDTRVDGYSYAMVCDSIGCIACVIHSDGNSLCYKA